MNTEAIWILALGLAVAGCEPGHGPMGGASVPNARAEIELATPLAERELLDRLDEVAHSAGFHYRPDSPAAHEAAAEARESVYRSYTWHPGEHNNFADSDQFLDAFWETDQHGAMMLVLVYNQGGTSPFVTEDWRAFFRIVKVHVVQAFPDAVIRVTRHPAVYTTCDEMVTAQEATGHRIPEEIDWCEDD